MVLVIGNQRLDGKINQLKEPLAVMSKLKKAPAADSCVDGGGLLLLPLFLGLPSSPVQALYGNLTAVCVFLAC